MKRYLVWLIETSDQRFSFTRWLQHIVERQATGQKIGRGAPACLRVRETSSCHKSAATPQPGLSGLQNKSSSGHRPGHQKFAFYPRTT